MDNWWLPATDCGLVKINPDACPEPFPSYVEQWTQKGRRCFKCKACNETYDGRDGDDNGRILMLTYRQIVIHLHSSVHTRGMEEYKQLYCDACHVQFPTKSKYTRHCYTRKHQAKEAGQLPPTLNCETCEVTFQFPIQYKRHLMTKAHTHRLLPPPQRECSLCGIRVLSDKQMAAHLATRKHQRKLAQP
jgi:hypothetical protein